MINKTITITTPIKETEELRDKLISEGVLSIDEIRAELKSFIKNNITVI